MEMTKEQLGQFIKETLDRYGKSRLHFAKRLAIPFEILLSVESGTCSDDGLYIKVLAELLRRIVPRKIKLKKIPAGLPNREELESMKSGNFDNLTLYIDVIQTLCKMPNRPHKKKKTSVANKISYKISKQPANRNEIIFKWRRWCGKMNVDCNVVNSILDVVDLNKCKSDLGSFSNPKILNEYLRMYRLVNEQNKNNWLKWCQVFFEEGICLDDDIIERMDFVSIMESNDKHANWRHWEQYKILLKQKESEKCRNKHYGTQSQNTRKEWGSAYKPARG